MAGKKWYALVASALATLNATPGWAAAVVRQDRFPRTPHGKLDRQALPDPARGDLGGMSFGFTVPKGGDAWFGDRRELRAINLFEISVVSAWPAYSGTVVAARASCAVGAMSLAAAKRHLQARGII